MTTSHTAPLEASGGFLFALIMTSRHCRHIITDLEGNDNIATIFNRLFAFEDVGVDQLVESATIDGILVKLGT